MASAQHKKAKFPQTKEDVENKGCDEIFGVPHEPSSGGAGPSLRASTRDEDEKMRR